MHSMTLCWAFVVLVYVGASQRIPLSALSRNPHKGPEREISRETGNGQVKEGPKEDRKSWLTKESRSRQSGDESRAEKREQKSERRLRPVDLQRPGWPTRENKSALLVALWEFSLKYTLTLAHRMHKKCHKLLPFLRLELTQVCVCLFVCSFLPPSRLCFAYL